MAGVLFLGFYECAFMAVLLSLGFYGFNDWAVMAGF